MAPDAGMVPPPQLRNGAEVLRAVLLQHAEQLIALLVEAECTRFLAHSAGQRDAQGRHSLVRNGLQPERTIRTGIGPVRVRLPKFRSRTGEHVEFRSMFVPRFARSAAEAEPGAAWRYLHAMIRRDIHSALAALMGHNGTHASMSIPEATRNEWAERCARLLGDALDERHWTRVWAFEVEGRSADAGRIPDIIVVLGEDPGGYTRLLAAGTEAGGGDPWAGVLRDLRARGLSSPMDTWVVSTCALGIVETLKAHSVDTFRQDAAQKRDPHRREAHGVRSGASSRLRGPGTWISALLAASSFGMSPDCDPMQGFAGAGDFAQHPKGKHQR
jgi:putative transposase